MPAERVSALGVVVACAGISASLAACGTNPDDLRSGPIPKEEPEFKLAKLPSEPSGPVSERIEWNVVKETSDYANDARSDTKAKCPDVDGTEDESVRCTVTYRGVEAEWSVDISSFSYEMKPATGLPVAREILEDTVRYEAETETVRCGMKKVQLISSDDRDKVFCVWADQKSGEHGKYVVEPSGQQFGTEGFWLKDAE